MNSKSKIEAAREYYDTHSAEDDIAAADLVPGEAEANPSPMSGYSVRLPTDVLDKARELATERGMTTGAWLREAIENAVTSHSSTADAVPVTDLLALVARHRAEPEITSTMVLSFSALARTMETILAQFTHLPVVDKGSFLKLYGSSDEVVDLIPHLDQLAGHALHAENADPVADKGKAVSPKPSAGRYTPVAPRTGNAGKNIFVGRVNGKTVRLDLPLSRHGHGRRRGKS